MSTEELHLTMQAQAIIAGFLDPDTETETIVASEEAWTEVRAMFPPIVYHRMVNSAGEIGDSETHNGFPVKDGEALDNLAKYLNDQEAWSGAEVCEVLAEALMATGREIDQEVGK